VLGGSGAVAAPDQVLDPGFVTERGGSSGARGRQPALGCDWSTEFSIGDLDDASFGLAVYDDGTGEALYAGGWFTVAGGLVVNHIARWDGDDWSGLGEGGAVGAASRVYALASFADLDGPALYVGGSFAMVGDVDATGIARWGDGSWSALQDGVAQGVGGYVSRLAVFDDGGGVRLYVGGVFDRVGEISAENIARWDGHDWTLMPGIDALAAYPNPGSAALQVFDDGRGEQLYVGGHILAAGGGAVSFISSWDGASWWRLDPDPGYGLLQASDLGVYDFGPGPELIVATGPTAGNAVVNQLARWNGTAWGALAGPGGVGVEGMISTIGVFGPAGQETLYVGGQLTSAGGIEVGNLARWDGSTWSNVAGPGGSRRTRHRAGRV